MLAKIKNAFLEIIFPVRCVGCGAEGEWFCEKCATKIIPNEKQFCPVCWTPSFGGKICADCASPLDGLCVAASYQKNPELATAIRALKYKFSENLAQNLGAILVQAMTQGDYQPGCIIVPIPLHRKRLRWRGFNQAELLAKFVAQKLNLPIQDLLTRTKNTSQQAKLSRAERLRNLENAFQIAPSFSAQDKKFLLIDDVASTATTLIEAAKILKKDGAKEVWGLVLARG
ncbi:MAG: ComF family protein [Patescibacteria group bacterium]